MKLLVLAFVASFALVAGAQALSTSGERPGGPPDADAISRFLQVARGYETCLLKCETRFRSCLAGAETDDARRSCRLDRSLCDSDCSRFGSR